MDLKKLQFLTEVLGSDGAMALKKAVELAAARGLDLESALVPRAILAWLSTCSASEYEGEIPGIENTYLSFQKSENSYSGSITIGEDVYNFNRAELFHLASAVAVALGADNNTEGVRARDLEKLGKNLDLLAKAHHLTRVLAKKDRCWDGYEPTPGKAPYSKGSCRPIKSSEKEEVDEDVEKTDLPAMTARPIEPAKQLSPKQPSKQRSKAPPPPSVKNLLPKIPKVGTTIKISKSESERLCHVCGIPQFKNESFRGCLCFRELAKKAKVENLSANYSITLNGWDEDSIITFLETLGKKNGRE